MSQPDLDRPPELPEALGPFRVTGILGEGGSAVVYAADWEGREVALKVPRERELTDREQVRFLEEAKMLQRVRHPAVVEVLSSGRLPDGQPYLVMRRYEGETLADHLNRVGGLPVSRAVALFEQLAHAVDALHLAGLLHRDLKPENVLLTSDANEVKLLDFGIAKEIGAPASTTTQAGIARGTPATMAPERFFGAPASTGTDVYELTVVLYAMLVGRLPWTDVTNVQARLNPISPTDAVPGVPERLSTIVMQGLSTRPERRPQGISQLLDAVREAATTAVDTGPRATAAVRVTAATAVAGADLVITQKSDDAQVIESRRDGVGTRPTWPWIAAGILLLTGAVVAGALTLGSENANAGPSASGAAFAVSPTPALTPVEPTAIEAPAAPSSAASDEPPQNAPPATTSGAKVGKVPASPAAPSAAPSAPKPPKAGKPKGAPCTRSSECASMVCAAETCQ